MATQQHYYGKIPPGVWHVVEVAAGPGFTVSSNLSREFAREIALAASMGWITTIRADGKRHLNCWNSTESGQVALNRKDHFK